MCEMSGGRNHMVIKTTVFKTITPEARMILNFVDDFFINYPTEKFIILPNAHYHELCKCINPNRRIGFFDSMPYRGKRIQRYKTASKIRGKY